MDLAQLQSQATNIAQEIARQFGVPPPTIIFGNYSNAEYSNGIIRVPVNIDPNFLERVIAHEMAHHIHVYYRIPCRTPQCEIFANMFEETWVRSRRYTYTNNNWARAIALSSVFGLGAFLITSAVTKDIRSAFNNTILTVFVTSLSSLF